MFVLPTSIARSMGVGGKPTPDRAPAHSSTRTAWMTSPSATALQSPSARPIHAYCPSRCGVRARVTKNWLDPVSRPARATPTSRGSKATGAVAELRDEPRDHAVDGEARVEARPGQRDHARGRDGREPRVEADAERPALGLEDDAYDVVERVAELRRGVRDRCGRRAAGRRVAGRGHRLRGPRAHGGVRVAARELRGHGSLAEARREGGVE